MTEPNPDLDERLARLAQRKASSRSTTPNRPASAAATAPTTPTEVASINPGTRAAPAKRARRRHPAAAGRILSVGLSSSAFLSMVAAFGSQPASGASGAVAATVPKQSAAKAAPRPKIVIKDVHHITYVDQWGRPVAPPSVPAGIAVVPGSGQPAAGSVPTNSGLSLIHI